MSHAEQEFDEQKISECIPNTRERYRFYGKIIRTFFTELPLMAAHRTVGLLHTPTEEEILRKDIAVDSFATKIWKYVLENEIGTEEYRLGLVDELSNIKEERDLPQETLISEM